MASSNDIEVLDPTATVEKLKNIVSKVALDRRHFMAALGAAGVAAGTGLRSVSVAHAQQPTPNGYSQTDVLNFLLNLKYLKATFYSFITQGVDLPVSYTAANGNTYAPILGSGPIYNQPAKVTTFSTQIADMFNEMYYDDLNQVIDLQQLLGGFVTAGGAAVSRQTINLLGTSAANATWSAPSATTTLSAVQAIALARMFEDLSVTACAGAISYLTGTNLAYAAQSLATDGAHAAALRLASIQTGAPYQGTMYQSAFQVATISGSNSLYAVLPTTSAVVGDIIVGTNIANGSVITSIAPTASITTTGVVKSGTNTITSVSSIAGLVVGQPINGTYIPALTYITTPAPSGTTITISANATGSPALAPTGYLTSGSPTITGVSSVSGLIVGQTITATGIPANATITAASGTTITMSANATSTPLVSFIGTLTSGSPTISNVSSGSGLAVGQVVNGTGIPTGTTITNIGSNITMSANATASSSFSTTATFNGILTSGSAIITLVQSTAGVLGTAGLGLAVGQPLTGSGITSGTLISSISATTVTMSATATASSTTSTTGTVSTTSNIVTNVQSITGMIVGQTITGTGIPANTTITAIGSTAPYTLTLSAKPTAVPTAVAFNAITTSGSNVLSNVSTAVGGGVTGLVVGQPLTGVGIPTGTTITNVGTAPPYAVTMSANATATFTPSSFLADSSTTSPVLTNTSPVTASITGLAVGQALVASAGIANNTTITAIGVNSITMSANATANYTTTGNAITTAELITCAAQVTLTTPLLQSISSGGQVLTSPTVSTLSSPATETLTIGNGAITISQPATGTGSSTVTIVTSDPDEVVPVDIAAYAATVTSGSTTVSVSSITGLVVGQVVIGTGIPSGTKIASINSTLPYSIVLSAAATASATSFSVPALAAAGPVIDKSSSPAVYQGFFATAGSGNTSNTTPAGFAFARTFSQVLGCLYASTTTGTYNGGFYPVGVSGNINLV